LQIAYEKMMKNLHILEAEISRHGTKELMWWFWEVFRFSHFWKFLCTLSHLFLSNFRIKFNHKYINRCFYQDLNHNSKIQLFHRHLHSRQNENWHQWIRIYCLFLRQ
jgi:hypothetical protein